MADSDRLLLLAEQLYRQRGGRLRELARQFAVSERTMRRDLARLRLLGAPIRQVGPGLYQIDRDYRGLPDRLGRDELDVLDAALTCYIAALPTDGTLGPAMSLQRRFDHARARDWIEQGDAPGLLVEYTGQQTHAGRIRQAIAGQRKLLLGYYAGGTIFSERVIWPLALAVDGHRGMLAAWCELRSDFRSFSLRSMNQTRVLNEPYPGDQAELLARHAEHKAGWANRSHGDEC